MLIGTVAEVGPDNPLGLRVGQRVATLVSLSLTPLHISDALMRWDGLSEQVPAAGHAILFERSIAAVLPDDLDPRLALMAVSYTHLDVYKRQAWHRYKLSWQKWMRLPMARRCRAIWVAPCAPTWTR